VVGVLQGQVQLEPTSRHQLLGTQAKVLSKYTGLTQAIQDIFREEGVVVSFGKKTILSASLFETYIKQRI
jgi:hypothetical protein